MSRRHLCGGNVEIDTATRIIELTFGEERGRAAILDVRRGVLHEARRRRPRDYDTFLASEVSAFLWMFRSIRGAA